VIGLKNDIENFTNNLRLIEYFKEEKNEKNVETEKDTNEVNNTTPIKSLIKQKTTFCPPKSADKVFENQIDFLSSFPIDNLKSKNTQNLSKSEWFSLKSLMNDKDLVIKKQIKAAQ